MRPARIYVAEIPHENGKIGPFIQADGERPDHWRGYPFPERGYAEYRQDIRKSGPSSKRVWSPDDAGN